MVRLRKRANRSGSSIGRSLPAPSTASWLLIGSCAILLVAAFGLSWFLRVEALNIDKMTFCDKRTLPAVTAILIDSSDTIDPVQKERVKARLLTELTKLPKRSRVDIFVLDREEGELISSIYSKCNPGPPGEYDYLISDAKRKERDFLEGFKAGIEGAVEKQLVGEASDTSPILESIRSASARSFASNPETPVKRLVVVSDMLQNSALFNHYRALGDFENFKRSPAWAKALSPLEQVRIEILYISRSETRLRQGLAHLSWWERYFSEMRSHSVEVSTF